MIRVLVVVPPVVPNPLPVTEVARERLASPPIKTAVERRMHQPRTIKAIRAARAAPMAKVLPTGTPLTVDLAGNKILQAN